MASKDFYETLGVTKNSAPSDIKKAHYGQAKKLHPDTNKDDPEAENKFQEVQKAHKVDIKRMGSLMKFYSFKQQASKSHKKRQHNKNKAAAAAFVSEEKTNDDSNDLEAFVALMNSIADAYGISKCGAAHNFESSPPVGLPSSPFGGEPDQGGWGQVFPFGGEPFGAEDIFSKIFGNRDFGVMDVEGPLGLSFMEAEGCTRTVFQTELRPSDACGGSDVPPGTKPEACRRCRGAGMTTQESGPLRIQFTCSRCGGSGKYVKSLCKSCNGRRVVRGPKSVKVVTMPGVEENETMKVLGSGGADPEGNQPGDLYVALKVPEDPIFRREGPDIHLDGILINTQATVGGTIQVPTLTGDGALKVRPGTPPGQKIVLKTEGSYKKTGNKASRSFKERQHKKKNKNAATSASAVSEEKTNDDSHDLEDFVALMDSIADAYGISKCGGIPNSPRVSVPKRDTGAGYDDQTPPATECRYKETGNKASKSLKERQCKENKVAATSASASVSEEKTNDDSRDLEDFVALMDSIADCYGISKCGAAHVGIPNSPPVSIPKRDTGAGYDDQTPPATESFHSLMDTSGVSLLHTPEFPKYNGPVKNSAGNLENWVGIPGVYIRKREARAGCDNQTAPATESCYSYEGQTLDTSGVSVVHTLEFPKYNHPVKNSAGNLENWVGIPGVFIRKREARAGCDNQTDPAAVSCYSDDWVPMDTSGVSFVRTHKFPEYNSPPVKNSAGNLDNWVGIPGVYIRKREIRAGCDNQTAPTASAGKVEYWTALGNPSIF